MIWFWIELNIVACLSLNFVGYWLILQLSLFVFFRQIPGGVKMCGLCCYSGCIVSIPVSKVSMFPFWIFSILFNFWYSLVNSDYFQTSIGHLYEANHISVFSLSGMSCTQEVYMIGMAVTVTSGDECLIWNGRQAM